MMLETAAPRPPHTADQRHTHTHICPGNRKRPLPLFGRNGVVSVFWEISLFPIQQDVRKSEGASAASYLGTYESSGSHTSSSFSSHEEPSRSLSRRFRFSPASLGTSGWSDYILKYLLISSNLLFTALGLATLVLGLWGLINKESFAQEKISGIGTDPMLLFLFLGLVLALLSMTGCIGALRENMCLLRIFSAAVFLLVVAQVLAAVALFSMQAQMEDYLRLGMLTAIVRYQDDLDLRFITDEIQTSLQCCGVDTYRDNSLVQVFQLFRSRGAGLWSAPILLHRPAGERDGVEQPVWSGRPAAGRVLCPERDLPGWLFR